MIADIAGISRGKAMPFAKFMREDRMFLPTSVFHQTIAGDYVDMDIANQWTESDMVLKPDYAAATASALGRGRDAAGHPRRRGPRPGGPSPVAPRNVLKRVVGALRGRGLAAGRGAGDGVLPDQAEPQPERADRAAGGPHRPADGQPRQAYSMTRGRRVRQGHRRHLRLRRGAGLRDRHHHPGGRRRAGRDQPAARRPAQARRPGVLLQAHDPRGGARNNCFATFMAKPMQDEPGSAMHIHQSVVDAKTGKNIFTDDKGGADQGLLQLPRRPAAAHPDRGLHAGALREQLPPLRAARLGADQPRVGAGQPHHRPAGPDRRAARRGGSRTGSSGWTATPTSRSPPRSPAATSG